MYLLIIVANIFLIKMWLLDEYRMLHLYNIHTWEKLEVNEKGYNPQYIH